MNINNPLPADRMYTDDGDIVHCKVLDILTWNMDTANFKAITHGLGDAWKRIIGVSAWIRNDANNLRNPTGWFRDFPDPGLISVGIEYWDDTFIYIVRRTGGAADIAGYSSTAFSRGQIFVWYRE